MPSKLIAQNLRQADPLLAELLAAEDRRQADKLIMIASESITPPAVREALSCSLSSLYAEGYPHPRMARSPESHLADTEAWLAHYRRYSGKRFYKGVEFADFVEALAQRRGEQWVLQSGPRLLSLEQLLEQSPRPLSVLGESLPALENPPARCNIVAGRAGEPPAPENRPCPANSSPRA